MKAVSKIAPSVKIVKGFTTNMGNIPLEEGLTEIVRELYCPPKTTLSFKAVHVAKYQPMMEPFITEEELIDAIKGLSHNKAVGCDGL